MDAPGALNWCFFIFNDISGTTDVLRVTEKSVPYVTPPTKTERKLSASISYMDISG